jgi:hypothetical protein
VILALWVALTGCQTSPYPAPILGTTYRIDDDVPGEGSELRIDVMTSYAECAEAKVVDMDACLPRADRASGELHFGFQLRDPTTTQNLPRAISADQVKVVHDQGIQSDVQVVPHEPVSSGQLFVILIDGSGSMYENNGDRINRVYAALLKRSVENGFFPEGNTKSGVVLLRFSDKVAALDGGAPKVLTSRQEYEHTIRTYLTQPSGGYTHLYDAVRYVVTDLLDVDAIKTFLTIRGAEPSILVVTDGFNDEAASDTCATNVPKLQALLDTIREVRSSTGSSIRPTIHTVGLGKPYRKGNKPPGLNRAVNARDLCGEYADYPIDPNLEDVGIDHVSMQWIAEVGGGRSFVKSQSSGLAQVLESAAATRYRWYEVFYRVPDNFYHRKSFDVEVQLESLARAKTKFHVYPNAWLDGPTGLRAEGDRWHTPGAFGRSLAILMPSLGVLVLANYLGPAMFNTRRALFRRARPRGRRPTPPTGR